MSMTHGFTVQTERDESDPTKFCIVIVDSSKQLVGMPMRGVTKEVATKSIEAITAAFDYGIRAANDHVARTIYSMIPPTTIRWGIK